MFICFVCFHLNSRAEVSPRVLIGVSGSDGESAATGPESLLLKVAMQKKTEASRERMYVHHLWLPTSGPGAGKAHRVRQQSASCLLNELFLYSSSFRPYQVTTTLIWRMFHQSWLIVSYESEGTPGSWLNTNVLIDFTTKIKNTQYVLMENCAKMLHVGDRFFLFMYWFTFNTKFVCLSRHHPSRRYAKCATERLKGRRNSGADVTKFKHLHIWTKSGNKASDSFSHGPRAPRIRQESVLDSWLNSPQWILN